MLKSKLFKTVFFLAVLLLAFLVFGEFQKKYQIQKEVAKLQKEIEAIESKNFKLSELLEFYKTSEYRELKARELLNLQKEGEFAVVLPYQEEASSTVGEVVGGERRESNLKKWRQYFFGKSQ